MRLIFAFLLISLNYSMAHSQNTSEYFCGTFSDSFTTNLTLNPDSTFKLKTVDYIFPQTYELYTNNGIWLVGGKNEIILNPNFNKRIPRVRIEEKQLGLNDSIQVKINYYLENYEKQKFVKTDTSNFELLTIYFNKPKKYFNVLHEKPHRICAFQPKIKHQIIIDSTNVFKIAKEKIEAVGIFTYGFIEAMEIEILNPNSDYFEISITIPVDKERMPRNKKVIVKKNKAFYYERNGKVSKWLTPLKKATE